MKFCNCYAFPGTNLNLGYSLYLCDTTSLFLIYIENNEVICFYRLCEYSVSEGLHDLGLELPLEFFEGHLRGLVQHLVRQLLVYVPDVRRLQTLQVLLQRHIVELLLRQPVVIYLYG
jgi:hypothetical protein